MYKIAFLGPRPLVEPLWASGLEIAPCETAFQAKKALQDFLQKGDYVLIFITERLAAEMLEEIEVAEEKGINILTLPDHRGSSGFFKERLDQLIKKATGALKV